MDDRLAAVSHAIAVEPDRMTEVLKKVWITVYCIFSNTPIVENLASSLDVHSSPEIHAAGSTVRSASASGVTEMSNGHVVTPTSSREDGHCMDNVTVGNTKTKSLICAQRLALDRMVEHVRFAFDTTNLAA